MQKQKMQHLLCDRAYKRPKTFLLPSFTLSTGDLQTECLSDVPGIIKMCVVVLYVFCIYNTKNMKHPMPSDI